MELHGLATTLPLRNIRRPWFGMAQFFARPRPTPNFLLLRPMESLGPRARFR